MRNVPAHHGVDLKKLRNPAHAARQASQGNAADTWTPPVLATIADRGEGIDGGGAVEALGDVSETDRGMHRAGLTTL